MVSRNVKWKSVASSKKNGQKFTDERINLTDGVCVCHAKILENTQK